MWFCFSLSFFVCYAGFKVGLFFLSLRLFVCGCFVFVGGVNDIFGFRDCCWSFLGEVNIIEARF